MQIDANTINMLIAQWHAYILNNPLNGVIIAAAIASVVIWILLKIYYGIQLKKLANRLNKEIAAKVQDNQKLSETIESQKLQLHQADANLGVKDNQIAQIEAAKQVLQGQVDQLNRVKALIAQSGQALQTSYGLAGAIALNAEDDIDKVWQNYNGVSLELNNLLKSHEQKNFELQQLNIQNTAKLAEQELSQVALQETVKTQMAQLTQLREDYEAQNLRLKDSQAKQEADQRLIQELQQKSNLSQILPQSIQEPLETVVRHVQNLEEPASKVFEQMAKVQDKVSEEAKDVLSDAVETVTEAVESVIDAGNEIVDDITETVTREKEKGFKFFKSMKKSLHIGDKAVPAAAGSLDTRSAHSEPETDDQPILKKLEVELKQFHEAVSEEPASESDGHNKKPSKFKSFFGKKKKDPVIEEVVITESVPEVESTAKSSKFKNFFGKKKSNDHLEPVKSEPVPVEERSHDGKSVDAPVKAKGFFSRKKEVVDEVVEEAVDRIDEVHEEIREEKIYRSVADETREIAEKLGKLKGIFSKKK